MVKPGEAKSRGPEENAGTSRLQRWIHPVQMCGNRHDPKPLARLIPGSNNPSSKSRGDPRSGPMDGLGTLPSFLQGQRKVSSKETLFWRSGPVSQNGLHIVDLGQLRGAAGCGLLPSSHCLQEHERLHHFCYPDRALPSRLPSQGRRPAVRFLSCLSPCLSPA